MYSQDISSTTFARIYLLIVSSASLADVSMISISLFSSVILIASFAVLSDIAFPLPLLSVPADPSRVMLFSCIFFSRYCRQKFFSSLYLYFEILYSFRDKSLLFDKLSPSFERNPFSVFPKFINHVIFDFQMQFVSHHIRNIFQIQMLPCVTVP